MPSELDCAWAAGIIDGDGTITLRRVSPKHAKRAPFLAVDNTDMEILESLQKAFGGSIRPKGKPVTEHHRQAWSWRMYGATNIITVLGQILPYMRCAVKRERARMLVEEWKSATPRNGHYTESQAEVKKDFEERFMKLGEGRGWRSFGVLNM